MVSACSVWERDGGGPYGNVENVAAKSVIKSTGSFIEMGLLDPGFYDSNVVGTSPVWKSDGVDPYENVAAKSVIKNTGSFMDMDLLDPGYCDSK